MADIKLTQEFYDSCNRKTQKIWQKYAKTGSIKMMDVFTLLADPAVKANQPLVDSLNEQFKNNLKGRK